MKLQLPISILLLTFSLSVFASPTSRTNISNSSKMMKNKITGPLSGVMGIVVPEEKAILIYKFEQTKKNEFYSGSDAAISKMKSDFNYQVEAHNIGLRYGIAKRLELKLVANVYKKELSYTGKKPAASKMATGGKKPGSGMGQGNQSGQTSMMPAMTTFNYDEKSSELGDTSFFTKYQIAAPVYGNPYFLSASLGVKLPTGETTLTSDDGKYLPWMLQTSSGSFDGIAEFAFTKKGHFLRFDAGIRSFLPTEGDRGFKGGKKHILSVFINSKLSQLIDLGVGSTYRVMEKNSINNILQDNSGGKFLYLTPTLSLKLKNRAQISLAASYLVSRDVNGMAPSEDYQLQTKLLTFF